MLPCYVWYSTISRYGCFILAFKFKLLTFLFHHRKLLRGDALYPTPPRLLLLLLVLPSLVQVEKCIQFFVARYKVDNGHDGGFSLFAIDMNAAK